MADYADRLADGRLNLSGLEPEAWIVKKQGK
jgi:hypothetical protein